MSCGCGACLFLEYSPGRSVATDSTELDHEPGEPDHLAISAALRRDGAAAYRASLVAPAPPPDAGEKSVEVTILTEIRKHPVGGYDYAALRARVQRLVEAGSGILSLARRYVDKHVFGREYEDAVARISKWEDAMAAAKADAPAAGGGR